MLIILTAAFLQKIKIELSCALQSSPQHFYTISLITSDQFIDVLCVLSVDEDMDELEKELKALLDESEPDVNASGLPAVPTNRLGPAGEQILSPLPDVPRGHLHVTADALEEELNRLTLSETGAHLQIPSVLSVFQPFQTTCRSTVFVFRISTEEGNITREESRGCSVIFIDIQFKTKHFTSFNKDKYRGGMPVWTFQQIVPVYFLTCLLS